MKKRIKESQAKREEEIKLEIRQDELRTEYNM